MDLPEENRAANRLFCPPSPLQKHRVPPFSGCFGLVLNSEFCNELSSSFSCASCSDPQSHVLPSPRTCQNHNQRRSLHFLGPVYVLLCFGKHFVVTRSKAYVRVSLWTDYSEEITMQKQQVMIISCWVLFGTSVTS